MLAGGAPNVWLARGLCAYQYFDPAPARGAAAWAAARLQARSAAPFLDAGVLVARSGRGFSLWWWDQAVVEPALASRFAARRPLLAPETFAPPVIDGWRVLRLGDGFEAQLWRAGGLVASSFRRRAFDAASWDAFVRVQAERADAPAEPPAPIAVPRAPFPRSGLADAALTPERLLRAAPAAVVVLSLTATAFWLGQGLRLRADARDLEHLAAAERLAAPTPRAVAERGNPARRLAAFQALSDRPNPIAALGVATRILRLYGVGVEAVDAQGDQLSLTVPYTAIGAVDRIARELEASGAFADVRPMTNAADHSIQLRMRLTGQADGAALSPGG